MVTVLLVEDDAAIRLLARTKLKAKYQILEAGDGETALEIMEDQKVDLMVVDIMMPNMDGYEFVEILRQGQDRTPVIMLTAMDTFEHKKKAFGLGIDDYLTKPVNYDELIWHIEAVLRRTHISSEQKISIGGLMLSEADRSASFDGKQVDLTDKEFQLLYKLLSYPDRVFTKQKIMDEVWGYESEADYSVIKTYINRLRKKFEGCHDFELVSVRGLGYKASLAGGTKNE